MLLNKYILLICVITISSFTAEGQTKPYPQSLIYPNCIKPSNVSQEEMDESVKGYYDYWKKKYLRNDLTSLPGGYYVKGEITGSPDGFTPLGSSEGQGYGMIIVTLMAGYDPDAQTIFNGLLKTVKAYKSSGNRHLMGWVVADDKMAQGHFGSATDGDLDIAYSLLLAHKQWGTSAGNNYLSEAKRIIIKGIRTSYITNDYRLNLGDWKNETSTDTRPSDWMLGHFKAFKKSTRDMVWDSVSTATYEMIAAIQNNYSATTSLMPDFATGKPVKPAGPDFLEGPNDGNYYYNACRTPLRFVMDYAHYGDIRAKNAVSGIVKWAKSNCHNSPSNIKAGYTLNGNDLPGNNYKTSVFIAPIVAAATCDRENQAFLNEGWSVIKEMKESYFEDSYNLLSLLFISGNWWAP
ncbi:chitosanase-glucanase [Sporocytophaga myxococcoides]|uniref:Glucanase n=1 Tax=Sporocytophaga myxococcoides TaxID=153721 RepID=A0A098LGG2_9BACT|nr:glycosyl hydrolase family 8 [Sporocytophaga myxococcoides]GAL85527.1 chitosanase-glucanase [Sporocytophaga myxococcoides]